MSLFQLFRHENNAQLCAKRSSVRLDIKMITFLNLVLEPMWRDLRLRDAICTQGLAPWSRLAFFLSRS